MEQTNTPHPPPNRPQNEMTRRGQLNNASPLTYRPMPPREYTLGNEVHRSDTNSSFVPTLLPSSSLRKSGGTGGSQYSWSSRSGSRGESRGSAGAAGRGSGGGGGGGLSSVNITMNSSLGSDASSRVLSASLEHASRMEQNEHQEHGESAMGRISEEDKESLTSGYSSTINPPGLRDSEEDIIQPFERSDFRCSIDSKSYLEECHKQATIDLASSPNVGISPYESEGTGLNSEAGTGYAKAVTALFMKAENDEDSYPSSTQQHRSDNKQNTTKRLPQDALHNPPLRPKLDTTPPHTTSAPLAITELRSPASVSTMDSESINPELAATARFGRLLQQCRELTETCENSTVDESERMGSGSHRSRPMEMQTEIHTTNRVYTASEITMDPFLKAQDFQAEESFNTRRRLDFSNKSTMSDLSLGVDQMYNDVRTGRDYTDVKSIASIPEANPVLDRRPSSGLNSCSSPVSELSYSDRRGDAAMAKLSARSNQTVQKPIAETTQIPTKSGKPDFMAYMSNAIKDSGDERRSWLSYTDDEKTPRNSTRSGKNQTFNSFIANKATKSDFKPPTTTNYKSWLSDADDEKTRRDTMQSKDIMHTYNVPLPAGGPAYKPSMKMKVQQSPQSSFYSTDFSDEGSGGLLVGFGKRRKESSSSSSSSSDSSSSGFTNSDTSGGSGSSSGSSSSSSSSSSSEEETDESEPSMPAIAKGGLRLTHHQEDDVSALSFGGASALVVSQPPWMPVQNSKMLPGESNSRSRESDSSSTHSRSLVKSSQEDKQTSPDLEKSLKSSLSSGSGFAPVRRSSLNSLEKLGSDAPTAPRRATLAASIAEQLPQLDEESSDAASNSQPSHQKSASTLGSQVSIDSKQSRKSAGSRKSGKKSLTSQDGSENYYREVLAKTEALVSAGHSDVHKSNVSSFGSKCDIQINPDTISAAGYSEASPRVGEDSRLSKSSLNSFGSKRGKPNHLETLSAAGYSEASPKLGEGSRLSKSSFSSFGSKRDIPANSDTFSAADYSEASPKLGESSRLSKNSFSSFGSKRDTTTNPDAKNSYAEASPKLREGSRLSKSSVGSFGSKRNTETTSAAGHPQSSPRNSISSRLSRLSRSSKSSSSRASQKGASASRSSKNSLASFGSKRTKRKSKSTEAISTSTHDPSSRGVQASRLSRSSRSTLASFGSNPASALSPIADHVVETEVVMSSFQSSGQASNEVTYQPRIEEKSILRHHELDRTSSTSGLVPKEVSAPPVTQPTYSSIVHQPNQRSSLPGRGKSNATLQYPLNCVAEDDIDDHYPLQPLLQFPAEDFYPNDCATNQVPNEDDRSITSSVSSVVSKARSSLYGTSRGYVIASSSSVVSALSDHSQRDTKSRGSFRKSASDMIAERLSSKGSVGSEGPKGHTVQQLDSFAKSGGDKSQISNKIVGSNVHEQVGGLYEGFPSRKTDDVNNVIHNNRSETSRFYSSQQALEEADPCKPWRTVARKDRDEYADSAFFSEGAASIEDEASEVIINTNKSLSFDDGSALSEVVDSKAVLRAMGLYTSGPTIKVTATEEISVDEEINSSPAHFQEKHESENPSPKHLSRTSTASSITEWDFSGPNAVKSNDQVKAIKSNPSPRQSDLSHLSFEDEPVTLSTFATTQLNPTLFKDDEIPSVASASTQSDPSPRKNDQTSSVTSISVQSEPSQSKSGRVEQDKSPPKSPPTRMNEKHRTSIREVADQMSAQLEKSFLSRSQQQPHDFEAGSYDDLSSASEEDAVLAFLREEKEAHEKNQDSGEEHTILSEDHSVKSESDQSESEVRTNNFVRMFSKRMSFKIKKDQEEEKREEGSESEYVVAQIRPIFPGSERSSHFSSHIFDDSDIESGLQVPDEDGDNKSTESKEDNKESKKEFWKSRYFIPGCAFLLVVIIVIAVIATGSEKKEPTLQPTVLEVGNESVPSMPSSPSPVPTAATNLSVWVQVGGDIKGGPGEELGFSVASSEDGGRFIAGSRRSAKDNMRNRGAASIYGFDDRVGSYSLIAQIHGDDAGDQCGYSVAISKDGTRVAIGSLGSDKNGNNSGQVRVFDENTLTKEWQLVQEFLGEIEGSLFGTSVSLSQDGTKIAVGAPHYSSTDASRIGKIYTYEEIGEATWNPMGDPLNGESASDLFGWSVSWSPDANLLAIGAPGEEDASRSGYVKVYSHESNQWNSIGRSISNDLPGDRFGFSLSLGGNGSRYRVAVGAPGTASANGKDSGYAGIYEYDESSWSPVGNGVLGGWGEQLGYAVSLTPDAERMVVGVPNKLSNGLPSGQIQVFDIRGGSLVSTGVIDGKAREDFGVSGAISYDGRIIFGGTTAGNAVRAWGEL